MMDGRITLTVPETMAGSRCDVFLAAMVPELSRSAAQHLLEESMVTKGDKPLGKKDKMAAGDILQVTLPQPKPAQAQPEDIPLFIVYEDEDVVVINKKKGMVVHPAAGNEEGTLVNALLHHCGDLSGIGGVERPGIVHRLDKDTSGILLVAATFSALRELQEAIRQRSLIKEYVVWVRGRWPWPEARLLRHQLRKGLERGFEKMRTVLTAAEEERALEALCLARPLRICENESLLLIRLFTGRTHQIRVQLASLGHPVLGDVKYGPPEQRVGACPMYLHALRVILPGGRIFACLPDWDAEHAVGVLPEVMPVPAEHQGQINVEN